MNEIIDFINSRSGQHIELWFNKQENLIYGWTSDIYDTISYSLKYEESSDDIFYHLIENFDFKICKEFKEKYAARIVGVVKNQKEEIICISLDGEFDETVH